MKSWLNRTFLFFIAALTLASCEKDEEKVFVQAGTAPVLSANKTSVVLTEAQAKSDALTISWTPSDFGYQAAVNYTLQLDMKGNSFKTPVVVNLGSKSPKKFTVEEFNSLLNRLPITAFRENQIEARLVASVSPKVSSVASNVMTVTATPYLKEPPYKTLYLVGGATEFGWDNTKATPMFRSKQDVFVYTFTGYFKADIFKFLGEQGKWAPMWGKGPNNTLVFREKESDPDPASFEIPAAGYYTVVADLRNMTYSITPFNASAAPTYPSIGIIGEFSGWSNIVPMQTSSFNPHIWTITYTFDKEPFTEWKFRHAPNWDVNWGTNDGEQEDKFGVGKPGGPNFKTAPGKYLIMFNDLTANWLLIKQ